MEDCTCVHCSGDGEYDPSWERLFPCSGAGCDGGIHTGEEYVELEGCCYHLECLEWLSIRELMAVLGVPVLCQPSGTL